MKPGTVIKALARWSMDIADHGKIIFDVRDCDVGERFIVLTEPIQMPNNYMGVLVQGRNGVEMINEWVHNRKAFGQIADSYFEEIK